ncbi:MAG TPA: hypothetical protein PLA65_11010 [Spirochaetota bacterium]|nr:hypothetical protein [Spirochaetota bacterium]HOD15812.1 hypothetical protein [Spirochaetota bacterium]HPN12585.1 hypothetical protein [Spirochaetota bacterium]
MKYAFTFIVILVTLLGSTMIMAQTSDCQKKCTDAFIKCSGTCASSADASCGAKCFKERDACTKNCVPEKAKPEPVDKEKKAEAEKKVKPDTGDDDGDIEDAEEPEDDADVEDENDIEDDSGTIDEPEDMENGPDDQDSTDINEEDL